MENTTDTPKDPKETKDPKESKEILDPDAKTKSRPRSRGRRGGRRRKSDKPATAATTDAATGETVDGATPPPAADSGAAVSPAKVPADSSQEKGAATSTEPPPPASDATDDPATTSSPQKKSNKRSGRGPRKNSKKPPEKKAASPDSPKEPPVAATKEPIAQAVAEEIPIDAGPSPKLKLLINSESTEECRVVLLEDGKIESFHVETISRAKTKGNIYKGRIVSVEANLQAAFVDIGLEKNAFMSFSDIHPEYYSKEVDPETHWKDLRIQDVVSKGTEVLVEVEKEAAGTKGASLTTYISLPGRFLVLMPGSDSHGISRKLEEAERAALREMTKDLKLPEGIGYIIRTASKNVTKTALAKDLRYLLNLWETIKELGQKSPTPSLLYKEQNIVARYLRDHFTAEVAEIIVDSREAYEQVHAFLDLQPARQQKTPVRLHKGSKPLFNHFNVEEHIDQIFQPKVKLPSGGSIVINPTEALVAIDVNSGGTSKDKDFEESIFLANMEAAEELARQLRLRDLGGLIVVDFIDMRSARHTKEVEKQVKTSMKRDKSKFDLSRISKFGLMQISRQRLGPPVQAETYKACPHCQGRGAVQSVESQVMSFLRKIQTGVTRKNIRRVACVLPLDVATYMLNKKRNELAALESKHNIEIQITAQPGLSPLDATLEFMN